MPITYTTAILSANVDSLTFGFNSFSSHTVPDKPSGFLLWLPFPLRRQLRRPLLLLPLLSPVVSALGYGVSTVLSERIGPGDCI